MGVADKLREMRWRAAGHYRPLPPSFTAPFAEQRLLEIGGPSALFTHDGILPLYSVAASVDNVQFRATTTWHDLHDSATSFAPLGRPLGTQFIIDDAGLQSFAPGTYDAVISSHVFEHFANPLKALGAWRRITDNGWILIVAPHKEGTFDRNRPVTTLEHLIADLEQDTGEDDLTHLEETLELHDFSRDVAHDRDRWRAERRENLETRVLHHHVFTTRSLIAVLTYAGVEIVAHETRFPHDIYIVGRFVSPPLVATIPARIETGPFDD